MSNILKGDSYKMNHWRQYPDGFEDERADAARQLAEEDRTIVCRDCGCSTIGDSELPTVCRHCHSEDVVSYERYLDGQLDEP